MSSIERGGKTFYLSTDGKEYKTRSGAWKRNKKIGSVETEPTPSIPIEETVTIEDTPEIEPEGEPEGESSKWMDFNLGEDDDATDVIPSPLKMITAQDLDRGRKQTAKELKAMRDTELAILKMGLSGVDSLLTSYGKAVTLSPDFKVKHSEGSKNLVANAQAEWLEEKGIFLTNYLSKGLVASTLTVWYVGGPLLRIKKKAKKPMFKRLGGGFMSKLPLIGRWFKPKKDDTFQIPSEGDFTV
mgnify:CR=1 FL=1